MTGFHLAHYRIDAELGRGGMGIVYRATDTNLDRTVAIKVLPPAALGSDDDRARFYREAKAAAQLHHPNIASVFQIDEAVPLRRGEEPPPDAEKRLFIAMEYVDGETLADRVRAAPLPLNDAVGFATQIAEALKAAHAKEIVHRDIKSANVMITADGVAKVLDFGLAQTAASTRLTRQGSTVGTAAYMSPEQARGDAVDGRTDLFSLGVVLYEMIAGRLPFLGDYEQAVIYSIINVDPEPLTALRTGVPIALEELVGKCLDKEPGLRYPSAQALLVDLRRVQVAASPGERTVSARKPRGDRPGFLATGAAIACLIIGALSGFLFGGRTGADLQPRHYSLPVVPQEYGWIRASFSTDGDTYFYAARDASGSHIESYSLKTGAVQRLATSEGGYQPVVSRDGQVLRFIRDGSLFRMPLSGGGATKMDGTEGVIDTGVEEVDGSLLFVSRHGIVRRSPDGSASVVVEPGPDAVLGTLVSSPGGKFAVWSESRRQDGSVIGSWLLKSGQDTPTPFLPRAYVVALTTSGHALYYTTYPEYARAVLMVVAIDRDTGERLGEPQIVGPQWFSAVSASGTYVFREVVPLVSEPLFHASAGQETLVLDPPGVGDNANTGFRFSPSGDRIAWISDLEDGSEDYALSVIDRATGMVTALVSTGEPLGTAVAWSHDGRTIYYGSRNRIMGRRPDSAGAPEVVLQDTTKVQPWSASPDGRLLAYVRGEIEIRILELESGSSRRLGIGFSPSFAPDSRHLAIDSPQAAIYVVSTDSMAAPVKVAERGIFPRWSPDGRYIYFGDINSTDLLRVPVSTRPSFRVTGRPEPVHKVPPGVLHFHFDVSARDEVYVSHPMDEQEDPTVHVVTNWFEELERLAPHGR